MFQNLLVPLDGSVQAEAALPTAACLAAGLGATVSLLHVIEQNAPRTIHHERHLREVHEAEQYLADVAGRFFPPSVHVERHVHSEVVRDVAQSIQAHIDELSAQQKDRRISPDLIIMSRHGRSSPRRWIFGSLAQQVISRGDTPLLLVPPGAATVCSGGKAHRFLVPLDANPAHAHSVDVAADLAKAVGATLDLLTVVPDVGSLPGERAAAAKVLPATAAAMLEIEQDTAENYLRGMLPRVNAKGVEARIMVRRGDPATMILAVAEELRPDLVVLSTHGKTGTSAFWSGSVGPRVAEHSALPVLAVPVHDG